MGGPGGWIHRPELLDPANQFPTSDRIVDDLLPLAQRKAKEFRTKPRNKETANGYYDRLDVSWTRPVGPMPFRYNTKYAYAAADAANESEEDDERPVPPAAERSEFERMAKLSRLHDWNDARPRYEVVPLKFGPAR